MKQHNFKFGDMVQHPEFGRGVVVAEFDYSVDVIFENNRTVTRTICFAFLSELELIPHTTQSGWISLADRLPENGEMVALYDGFTLVKAEFNAADGEDIVTPFFELHDADNTFNQICDDCINYRKTRIYLNEIPKFLWQLLPPETGA